MTERSSLKDQNPDQAGKPAEAQPAGKIPVRLCDLPRKDQQEAEQVRPLRGRI